MSSNAKTGQEPTHKLFAVKEGAEGKAFWTKIDAGWPHKDGKGLSFMFAIFSHFI
jgi:hypothetical protein